MKILSLLFSSVNAISTAFDVPITFFEWTAISNRVAGIVAHVSVTRFCLMSVFGGEYLAAGCRRAVAKVVPLTS